jgi:hypothetical protein
MKRKLFITAGSVAAFFVVSSTFMHVVWAQQSTSLTTPATTNWLGYLVVGQNDPIDSIAVDGLHPTVSRQVQIGLRSDGIVVWRQSINTK